MREFCPDLPPSAVDAELRDAVRAARDAERRAVLWFGEVARRRLYRSFGFSSVQVYAAERLGFSDAKTAQFLRLSRDLEALPELRRSVASGEVPWSKARAVASVATPTTEKRWVERARTESRRSLERAVRQTRGRARAARRRAPGQGSLLDGAGNAEGAVSANGSPDSTAPPHDEARAPASVTLRFPSPELHARFEALVEKLRKRHRRGSREELVVAALELLAGPDSGAPRVDDPRDPEAVRPGAGAVAPTAPEAAASTRVSSSAATEYPGTPGAAGGRGRRDIPAAARGPVYQVSVRLCPGFERGTVVSGRDDRPLEPAKLQAILCDARIRRPGERNRASIPPAVRRAVLERDGFRCRVPGCRSPRFLEVHHLVTRAAAGRNREANLVTLRSGCHRSLHALGWKRAAALLGTGCVEGELAPAS